MDYEIYKFLAPIIAGFNILSITISFRFRKDRISLYVLGFQLVAILFLVFDYAEFFSNNLDTMVLMCLLEHVTLQLIALFWFIFCLHYTGYEKIANRVLFYGVAISFFTNVAVMFTNNFHNLFYIGTNMIIRGGYSTISAQYGIYFWIVTAFDYIFIIAGVAFIILSYIRGGSFYRSQAQFIILSFIFPLVVNVIYIFRLVPGFNKDFSAVTFGMTGLFIFIGTNRFRLLHYSPISRNLILQNIEDALVTLSSDYRIIDYNVRASDIFSMSEKELGADVRKVKVGETLGNITLFFNDREDASFIKEIDKSIYNVHIKRIYSEKSRCLGIVISLTDITDKMNLLKELKKSNKTITKMQLQMIQQEKMAALGQLSAEVSHEINNPLTFIKSNISVLERYLDEGSFKENFTDIKELVNDTKDGIGRITDVVKNMLSYSREDEDIALYNINKGVETTLILARSIIRHRAELKLELNDVPDIMVRGKKVNQVILNLLVNAAYAIGENRTDGLITVKTYIKDDTVYCEVLDNGEPIKEEDRELIFEPFFTTKNDDDGTGLGLALSKKIIEKECSGRLYLKDSPQKTFVIELPPKII